LLKKDYERKRSGRTSKDRSILGDDDFVEEMQQKLGKRAEDANIPRVQQRRPAPSLEEIRCRHSDRNRTIRTAYETGAYSCQQIGEYFGVYFTTVGRIVRESRQEIRANSTKR
jgi:putative transposase